jgi:D-methionine transport system ATP-binding protein
MSVLKLDQVSYGRLLSEISLEIESGSLVCLVGAAGAGKTTLLRLLNRLIDPTTGKIFWEGVNYNQIPVPKLRRQIVLVPQTVSLLDMPVSEAICYPLKLQNCQPTYISSQLAKWVDRLNIDPQLLHRQEMQLSTGQKQWIAIARAMVMEPEILLLDEPTASLDRGRAELLLQILSELAKTGTTILMANHQLDLVEEWGTFLVQLERGQLVLAESAKLVNYAQLKQMLQASATANPDHNIDWD